MTRLALGATIALALGTFAAAALHAGPALLGWLAALASFALAGAAAATARDLHAPDDVREPRMPRGPTPPGEPLPADVVSRSGVFGRLWGAAAGVFALLAVVPFVALARHRSVPGTAWTHGARLVTEDGTPVKADTLVLNAIATVFPEGHVGAPAAATLLLRLQDDVLRGDPARADWAPQGNVAYSKICTHAGCPVAIYRQTSYQLYCPCHQSVFDVLDAARPVAGPATRALPQLALGVDAHGYLFARGDYSEPVGPDMWDRPV